MDKRRRQPGPPSCEMCSSIYLTWITIFPISEVFLVRGHFKVSCKFQKIATFPPQFEWEPALARSSQIRQGSGPAGHRQIELSGNDPFIIHDLRLFYRLWVEIR